MRSKFYEDKAKEELFARWLDKHLYPKLPIEGVLNFERVFDEFTQKKGVDIIVHTTNCSLLIDEKATMHYINKKIPTFAFELLNRTSGAQGWLFNNGYQTTHYLLAWPEALNPDSISEVDDYSNADVMLIEREALINLLVKKGLTERVLKEKVEYYSKLVSKENCRFELEKGIKLNFTEQLAEKPVNLVISKTILESISIFHKRVL